MGRHPGWLSSDGWQRRKLTNGLLTRQQKKNNSFGNENVLLWIKVSQ
jgi:hypothetical protein